MGDGTNIEWTDATWNPVRGCAMVSAGCTNCYAMKQAHRTSGEKGAYHGLTRLSEHGPIWTGEVRTIPELLDQPLRWKKPRRIFVNSMSDLFHEAVPDDFIFEVFAVMAERPLHQFQILTKRPERMLAFCSKNSVLNGILAASLVIFDRMSGGYKWPLPNVQLGVSVEDQETADERIPLLLQTPAAVRFISAEPLLGPIDLLKMPRIGGYHDYLTGEFRSPREQRSTQKLDWIIVGGESGPKARPMHPDWARSLRDQCVAAGVPFFFKQWGEFVPPEGRLLREVADKSVLVSAEGGLLHSSTTIDKGTIMVRAGKKAAGATLDGREWREYPGGDR